MESENESACDKDVNVAAIQSSLFPPQKILSTSYFSNFLMKCTGQFEGDQSNFDNVDSEEKAKLKESLTSKEIFGLNNSTFTAQPPRWPSECQVINEKVSHINYVPPTFEPYYVVKGDECQPKPTGEECGIVVYQYNTISAVNYFTRSNVGGSKYLLTTNPSPDEDSLQFESRFESGNLERAIKITQNYYELHLRADMYTNRHMQWFYFRVSHMKKQFLYRFSITNCSKEGSLYNEGMKPLLYSTKDSQLHSIGWRRCGNNITYFCNDNVTNEDCNNQLTYTLTFTVEFPHDDDEVYLAHSYPYTYSDLQDYLGELSVHPVKSTYTCIGLLCKTLAGNNVYYVTITSPSTSTENKKKKAVVLSARVHPGETPASWMMKGVLDFLTGDSSPAKELRNKFIFKIVPMLNPDGVIVGNNRCSLSAKDLNRQYRTVIRDAYPSIWYTKLLVRRLLEVCGVPFYCDLHAHSRKQNIFLYGCENRRGGEKKLQEQVFPLMLHKNTADKFSFESCKFRVQKAKEGTGRVVMWMMGITNSYTMEASFAGSSLGNRFDTHFSTQDFETMGKSFCETLLDFYDEEPRKEKLRQKIIDRLVKEGSNADEPTNINLSDYSSDDGDTSGSTTSDEAGREDFNIFAIPAVPPSSPIVVKRCKIKPPSKLKITRNPAHGRRPLPIYKTTLDFSVYNRSSSEGSDDEMQKLHCEKSKMDSKKKKKKKPQKKSQKHSNTELVCKSFEAKRSVSVFDLLPANNLEASSKFRRARTPQPKPKVFMDRKQQIISQLEEVQAKLELLKNRLWFGIHNGEQPLSWGASNFNHEKMKSVKKKSLKTLSVEKSFWNNSQRNSFYQETKQDSKPQNKTKVNGLKRQKAIDWSSNNDHSRIQKSKSLPDTSTSVQLWHDELKSNPTDESRSDRKKKKKSGGKMVKKVKHKNKKTNTKKT